MKPEELSDAIIEFQSKHAVSDTTCLCQSPLSGKGARHEARAGQLYQR